MNQTNEIQTNYSVVNGQVFTLVWPLVLGTGYAYTVSTTPELQLVTPNGVVAPSLPSNHGPVGARTTIAYTFRALQSGTATIDVTYGRAWDASTWTSTMITVNIH